MKGENSIVYIGKSRRGNVSFDLATLIDTRLLIQSNSGGGKSWAIRRLLEQSHGQVQQIVLDLEGEFNTLRERFDYVLAGRNGDTSADQRSAGLLARRLLELKVSAICDLYELKAHERVRFVRLFLESLVSSPKNLWHPVLVIVDEAHHFCPEKGQAESAAAVIDLITRGRKRGFCGVLATQRLSKLHKDAAAELLNKMIGRTSLDIDRKRAADELGFRKQDDSLALRDLRPGEFHTYGPAIRVNKTYVGGIIALAVGSVKTTHPKVGSRQIDAPPAPTAAIKRVLGKLADLPAEAEQQAQDAATLRKQVSELRGRLTRAERSQVKQCDHTGELTGLRQRANEAEKMVSVAKTRTGQLGPALKRLSDSVGAIRGDVARTLLLMENGHKPTRVATNPVPPRRPISTSSDLDDVGKPDMNLPRQRILDALAAYESVGLQQVHRNAVAARAGASPRSSAYTNNVSKLRVTGYIDYPIKGHLILTDQGRQQAGAPEQPISLTDLHDAWLRIISTPQATLLRVILEAWPESMSREELAERANVSLTSSAFTNNVSRLSTLKALTYPQKGYVKASELLFPEGLA